MINNANFFSGYDQYINWRPIPRVNGKTDKKPVGNHLDPRTWKTYEQATAQKLPIGFVFTESDPFFFLDIDDALQADGTWSPLAKRLCFEFAGCAVEISHSGRGLHIFGTAALSVPYKNKNSEYKLELYTQNRFVALTGVGAMGSAFTDATGALNRLAEEFFTLSRQLQILTAAKEYTNPGDDETLLQIARRSKSASATFGDGATFSDLYDCNIAVLAARYPSASDHGFDWSAADMALLAHLAFYTGRDPERMERLFSASALGDRDKWRDRPDYRERSISTAINNCSAVYTGTRNTSGSLIQTNIETKNPGAARIGLQFLDINAQINYFQGCVYVIAHHKIFAPKRGLLKPEQFRAVFGGYQFALAAEGRPTKNAFEAFTESQLYNFPKVDELCFRPEFAPGAIITEEGRTLVNFYEPAEVLSVNEDPSPFLDLLQKLLPESRDREILISYMAACVQYPGAKFQWAPVVQGAEGNGKTFLATAVSRAVGQRYAHFPNAADLAKNGLKFNGWMYGKLFIAIEDLFPSERRDLQEALKPYITNLRTDFQFKHAGQFTGDNRANYMTFCNHKDSVAITRGGRRYCPLYTAQQSREDLLKSGMGGNYFPELYDWARNRNGWAAITYYLKNYAIPDELNPATLCHRAPETSSTREAWETSLGPVEQEILEAAGEERLGFRGGWISSAALDKLLLDKKFRVALNKRRVILENLGYIVKTRLNNPSPADNGKKPVLYINKERSDLLMLPDGAETTAAYLAAQNVTPN